MPYGANSTVDRQSLNNLQEVCVIWKLTIVKDNAQ